MSLTFKEEGHLYENIDPNSTIKWTSVTTLVGKLKPKFDAPAQAIKSGKNKKSKWYGMTPEKILEVWGNENARANKLGNFYHNQRESDLLACNTLTKDGVILSIIPPRIQDGIKYAPDQKLIEGIYPELFVYLQSAGICGQADYVEVVNGYVNILDYKTNKEIKKRGYKNWEGIHAKMHNPISHIEDCNFMHYNLQMSIYMYIILKHNPRLKPGKLTLQHVTFEKVGDDEYQYPISKYDDNGEPIIDEITSYDVPYMKEEVLTMIKWLKNQK